MIRLEYIIPSGPGKITLVGNTLSLPEIIGKEILSVTKDGVGLTEIIPTSLTYEKIIGGISGKHCLYNSSEGFIATADDFIPGVLVIILYQDITGFCAPPVLQSAYILPDAFAELDYAASFTVDGTPDYIVILTSAPSWMTISIDPSNSFVVFGGKPSLSDVGVSIPVSFSITNNCGSVNFSSTINVKVKDAYFSSVLRPLGTRLIQRNNLNLSGTPGIIVTVKLSIFTNDNGGTLTVNGSSAVINETWNVTLDSTGSGSLSTVISMIYIMGTKIYGKFTIDSVSSGGIGSPNFAEVQKNL